MKSRILVIGASSDLGFPISKALSEKENTLFLHYHNNPNRIESIKSESVFLSKADLRNEEECVQLIEDAKHKM